ncbi:hypothetical protein JCM10213_008454 [Rhodosporidiobolus nylandii]
MADTATAPDDGLHDCAVCEKRTSTACSSCGTTFFCSRECQKLLWMTHKDLCRSPEGACYFPPLSTEDAAALKQLHTTGSGSAAELLEVCLEQLREKGWLPDPPGQRSMQVLIDDLASSSCTISEPRRSFMLIAISRPLHPGPSDKPEDWLRTAPFPWHQLGDLHGFLEVFGQVNLEAPGRDPFREMNLVYRQYLVLYTLIARAAQSPAPPALKKRHLLVAWNRAVERTQSQRGGQLGMTLGMKGEMDWQVLVRPAQDALAE